MIGTIPKSSKRVKRRRFNFLCPPRGLIDCRVRAWYVFIPSAFRLRVATQFRVPHAERYSTLWHPKRKSRSRPTTIRL